MFNVKVPENAPLNIKILSNITELLIKQNKLLGELNKKTSIKEELIKESDTIKDEMPKRNVIVQMAKKVNDTHPLPKGYPRLKTVELWDLIKEHVK